MKIKMTKKAIQEFKEYYSLLMFGKNPYDRKEHNMIDVRKNSYVIHPGIEKRFTYHAPKPGQPELYVLLRDQAKELAYNIFTNCPESKERDLAITKLEESIMWANASIARNSE